MKKKNYDYLITIKRKNKLSPPCDFRKHFFLTQKMKCSEMWLFLNQRSSDKHGFTHQWQWPFILSFGTKKAKGLRLPTGHVCFLGFRLSVNKKKKKGKKKKRIPPSLSSKLRHSVCVYHFLRAEGHCETTLSLSKVVCASLGLLQHFQSLTLMNWSHPLRHRFFLSLLWWRRFSQVFSWLRAFHLIKVQCAMLWHKKKL